MSSRTTPAVYSCSPRTRSLQGMPPGRTTWRGKLPSPTRPPAVSSNCCKKLVRLHYLISSIHFLVYMPSVFCGNCSGTGWIQCILMVIGCDAVPRGTEQLWVLMGCGTRSAEAQLCDGGLTFCRALCLCHFKHWAAWPAERCLEQGQCKSLVVMTPS